MADLLHFLGMARSRPLETGLGVVAMILVLYLSHVLVKKILARLVRLTNVPMPAFMRQLATDDAFYHRLSLFVPMLILYQGLPSIPHLTKGTIAFWRKLAVIGVIIIGISVFNFLMRKANQIYTSYPVSRTRPIKGYLQIVAIVVTVVGVVMVVATALDTSPMVFLSGLGAATAVIMLVFRDTILSLVAGMQLTANDLIRVGDWIEMPHFNADGDVVDIALHVVKVQNGDKTISVIPAHKFLEHSFKNWRGMQEAGARRIKRALYIDLNTIRFLDESDRTRFSGLVDLSEQAASGGPLTNIGAFRAYVIKYLRQHPSIHADMPRMVRQLAPGPEGVPLEIYVYVNDTTWARYEAVQAEIFDHLFAMVREFGLALYQRPNGHDLQNEPRRTKAPALPVA